MEQESEKGERLFKEGKQEDAVAVIPVDRASASDSDQERPLKPGATRRPLRILFVQEAPCIRNYKMAMALRSGGHRVCLAFTKARLSQMYRGLSDQTYDECFRIENHRQFWDLCQRFDVVHCHNEPDVLTVAALASGVPVVHDTHDLLSLRHEKNETVAFFEGVANRGASGRIYVSEYQRDMAARFYGIDLQKTAVVYNYISGEMFSQPAPHKAVKGNGGYQLVYEGGIGMPSMPHRYYLPFFKELAEHKVHVHIYPTSPNGEYQKACEENPFLHYHAPVSPLQIVQEISQYDFGIIPFNVTRENQRHLDSALPNKLFEYLAAGLPVIAKNLLSLKHFIEKHDVGFVYDRTEDLLQSLGAYKKKRVDGTGYLFDRQIPTIEQIYYSVLERAANRREITGHEPLTSSETESMIFTEQGALRRIAIPEGYFEEKGINCVYVKPLYLQHGRALPSLKGSGVRLGDNVRINFGCFLNGAGGISIGDNTILGPYVCVHTANHRYDKDHIETDRWDYRPVLIGANCWIGMNANILAGVRVGENSIVGANAVVTRDVPPNALAFGNPIQIKERN